MKLISEDKELLIKWGNREEDLKQIEEATTKTVYKMNDKRISRKRAIEILGREKYLSGISRSAFHWSVVRENEKGEEVYFDSSKLFA